KPNRGSKVFPHRTPLELQDLNQPPTKAREGTRIPNLCLQTVEAKFIVEDWLKSCVVGLVRDHLSSEAIQDAMIFDGIHGIKIRALEDHK
ncbi:hypothetical protein U1Q18_035617, partial [Sarracenia purpurea var. burkii]